VVVNYSVNERRATGIVDDIIKNGGIAIAVQADVSKVEDIQKLFTTTEQTFGKLDILVNNAGIYDVIPFEKITLNELLANTGINLIGPILCAQRAVALMQNGGSIINISSSVTNNAMPGTLTYAATKAGLENVTKTLAKELGSKKIRVNTIAPGITETEGAHEKGLMGGDWKDNLLAQTPLGRIAQPNDIAKVAVFLASDDSSWVTGERIQVSGGL
jgi:Dehydrogenases with different specificities (related to short-chain alcohol dehydrogenases)